MKKPAGVLHEMTIVPLYDLRLHVVVAPTCEEIRQKRNAMADVFGREVQSDFVSLCSSDHGNFGLFFSRDSLSHGAIAHEVFHAAVRMMEFIGDRLTESRPEPHAYLVQWITDWVYAKLKGEVIA